MSSESKNLSELKNVREHYRTRTFWLSLGILFIFGVPAGLAVIFGKMLDAELESGKQWTFIFLGAAFVLSWTILIVIWRKLDRELREIDAKIKEEMDRRKEKGILKPVQSKK